MIVMLMHRVIGMRMPMHVVRGSFRALLMRVERVRQRGETMCPGPAFGEGESSVRRKRANGVNRDRQEREPNTVPF